ncbi:nuclear transport factor 2 family protein [Parahaliea mediterranea]|uniref:Nuclear transport factor 2 family protein n=1 Tax=Parahaliea mediterranea TaxID=651086 RepID=A0A939IM94_9GAMM|nr:nuclear transport factor 2 family protein [Parahaliea mediterranea]MBN7799186.1 nuclear transport factor 2 family protein [Parahaliea mediterranea]
MNKEQAQKFAEEWVHAWNSHDLELILSHYDDEFEMSSPAITRLIGEPTGILKGKKAVGNYWAGALEKFPDLKFTLLHTLQGANSVALVYEGVLGLSNEVFYFGDNGKVIKAYAHYDL